MVNREKLRLMTDIAMFRKSHEQIFRTTSYFGYDYIVWHVLLAAVRFTICALCVAALFVVFDAETVFYNVNLEGLTSTLKGFAKYYFAGLGVYLAVAAAVYCFRYRKAKKDMLLYASMLRRLSRRFR